LKAQKFAALVHNFLSEIAHYFYMSVTRSQIFAFVEFLILFLFNFII